MSGSVDCSDALRTTTRAIGPIDLASAASTAPSVDGMSLADMVCDRSAGLVAPVVDPPPVLLPGEADLLDEIFVRSSGGLLSLEEACNRYTLTMDEFLSWQISIDKHGLAGLRTTRIQQYRQ